MSRLHKLTGEIVDRRTSVVLFHGLGGHVYDTWRQSAVVDSLWPLWLARDLPGIAVFSMGYDASISRWRGSAMHLTDCATSLLERLLVEPELPDSPLILIGHSFGGLVIKQLLRTAESEAQIRAEAGNFLKRVKKVVFLATPHTGSDLPVLGDRLRMLIRPSAATASLVRNDPNLRDLNRWYRNWASSSGTDHLILAETRPTKILGMVVRPDSSDPGIIGSWPIPIDADHTEICKPKDRSSDAYVHIRSFVDRPLAPRNTEPETLWRNSTNFHANNTTFNITINSVSNAAEIDKLVKRLLAITPNSESKIADPSKE
jgi:pimeloyl-ACP methyl ester carboxylesterase